MACPTCGHTFAKIGRLNDDRHVWHCERCGTVKVQGTHWDDTYVPKLVERCRQFEKLVIEGYSKGPECWNGLGIAESIRPPTPALAHDLGGES